MQYRDVVSGRLVSRDAVRHALDHALTAGGRRVMGLANELRDGKVTLRDWQRRTAVELKSMHLYSAAAAKGGWAQLTQADFGRVGAALREQYKYLQGFADQLSDGLALDGRFLRRAQMYAEAARATYELTAQQVALDAGYAEERNVLHPADHCNGCLDASAIGWVSIGTLVPVGQRECLTGCRCTLRYR